MKKLIPVILTLSLLLLPVSGRASADGRGTEGIRLPVHALILTMVENDLPYDADDDRFVWLALYYALTMYGQVDLRARVTEDALLLPAECAEDFLHALFARRAKLPPIPDGLPVSYDARGEEYRLALGDPGLDALTLGEPFPLGNGLYRVDGALTAPDSGRELCVFTVTLAEDESMFGYSVHDAAAR